MATVTMTIEEYEALMELVRSANGGMSLMNTSPAAAETPAPKKRRRSKYNRELSKQLKMLKKQHPRTAITKLMKKAHRATRKALK